MGSKKISEESIDVIIRAFQACESEWSPGDDELVEFGNVLRELGRPGYLSVWQYGSREGKVY